MQTFLWLAPITGVDFLFLPATTVPSTAEASAKQLYSHFMHVMETSHMPLRMKLLTCVMYARHACPCT